MENLVSEIEVSSKSIYADTRIAKNKKTKKIGLFGFGCVGQGLHAVLNETHGLKAEIKQICIKNPTKARSLTDSYFTTEKNKLLFDPEIDIIVELIDDVAAAFDIVTTAMRQGKNVVSANKKMIALHLPKLIALQQETGVSFLYEAACCASIPIIRNLEEYYDNDLLSRLEGIMNGTTNFILSHLFSTGASYESALEAAQKAGFAESDPTLDVEGYDAKYKLCILAFHAFGTLIEPDLVFNFGVSRLNAFDIQFAKSRNQTIKLIANCQRDGDKISAWVLPKLISNTHPYASIHNEYNAVTLETAFSEQQLLVGKGAGDKATGSAVLSDISALRYNYRYENHKYQQNLSHYDDSDNLVKLYVRHPESTPQIAYDFEEIHETYNANSAHYLTGKIRLEKLKHANWLSNKDVSILEL